VFGRGDGDARQELHLRVAWAQIICTLRRVDVVELRRPECHKCESKTRTSPAAPVTIISSGWWSSGWAKCLGTRCPTLCVPGTTLVAPLSTVKASSIHTAVTASIGIVLRGSVGVKPLLPAT
jgi:hypothetical protein